MNARLLEELQYRLDVLRAELRYAKGVKQQAEVRNQLKTLAKEADDLMIELEDGPMTAKRDWLDQNRDDDNPSWRHSFNRFMTKEVKWHAGLGEIRDEALGLARGW